MTDDRIPFGLSRRQIAHVEEFLHLFCDVETALKKKLRRRINDHTGIGILISEYVAKNPFWAENANQLRNLADIRNLLTHQRGAMLGFPIAVAPHSLKLLREIAALLLIQEPVSEKYRRNVKTVSADDSIAFVLALAYENGFSQFPAVNNGKFGGLITENEIVRWLGHAARKVSPVVNLENITVKMVLKEKDPSLKGICIFHFEQLTTPVEEVMGRFSTEPALEAILLTLSGNQNAPIEGMITQWDAARYSH